MSDQEQIEEIPVEIQSDDWHQYAHMTLHVGQLINATALYLNSPVMDSEEAIAASDECDRLVAMIMSHGPKSAGDALQIAAAIVVGTSTPERVQEWFDRAAEDARAGVAQAGGATDA